MAACGTGSVAASGAGGNVTSWEKMALNDLFTATNGSGWTNKTGWDMGATASDPCLDGWFGVVCNGSDPNAIV